MVDVKIENMHGNKGKRLSEEHKRKVGLAHIGKHYSKEVIRRGVEVRIKNGSYAKWGASLKGKKLSEEIKEKLRKINTGKHHSLETRKKMSELRMGVNAPAWKGGITPINQKIRHSFEYRLWRESVFKRDNWTCIFCGIKSGKGIKIFSMQTILNHLQIILNYVLQ